LITIPALYLFCQIVQTLDFLLSIDRDSITAEPTGALKMSEKSSARGNVEYAEIGAGTYCLLSYIFAFYPAMVWSVQLIDWFGYSKSDGSGFEPMGHFFCLLLFVVFSFCINRMVSVLEETWGILLVLYLTTLWPFIQLVMFYLPDGGYEESGYEAGFPGFDWIPFLFN
jgi:hypothetical protein